MKVASLLVPVNKQHILKRKSILSFWIEGFICFGTRQAAPDEQGEAFRAWAMVCAGTMRLDHVDRGASFCLGGLAGLKTLGVDCKWWCW